MKKINPYLAVAGVYLFCFLFVWQACQRGKIKSAERNASAAQLAQQLAEQTALGLRQEVNRLGQSVMLQEVVITQSQEALKKYSDSIFALNKKSTRQVKEIIAHYENNVQYKIKEVLVPVVGENPLPEYITDTFARANMILVPAIYEIDSGQNYFKATVSKQGLNIDSASISTTIAGRFVERKNGIFSRRFIEYQTMSTNPMVSITGSTSSIYKPKRNILKTLLPVAAGLAAGIWLSK